MIARPTVLAVLFSAITMGVAWGGHTGADSSPVVVEILGKPGPARDKTFVVAQFNPCPGGKCPDQSIAASEFQEIIGHNKMKVEPFGITLNELKGFDVYDSRGERVDEVAKVLEDKSGKVVAITIEVPTGILAKILRGGDSEVVVKLDELQYNRSRKRLETRLTKEQLSRLQKWPD